MQNEEKMRKVVVAEKWWPPAPRVVRTPGDSISNPRDINHLRHLRPDRRPQVAKAPRKIRKASPIRYSMYPGQTHIPLKRCVH